MALVHHVTPRTLPPDIAATNAATKQWMNDFFHTPLGTPYAANVWTCVAFLAIDVIMSLSVIGKRIRDKNFWVIRIQSNGPSKLIVPNTTTSFILLEGVFALCWVINLTVCSPDRDIIKVENKAFFWLIIYLPLFLGAWWAALGTFHLAPGISTGQKVGTLSVENIVSKGWLCNGVALGIPLIAAASEVVMTVLLGISYRQVALEWLNFDAMMATLPPDEPLSAANQALAEGIWQRFCDALLWSQVGFFIWCFWGVILLLSYLSIGGYLLYVVNQQIKAHSHAGSFGPGRAGKEEQMAAWSQAQTEAFARSEFEAVNSNFFPRIERPQPRHTISSTAADRARMLRGAFTLILSLFSAINLGVMGYVAIALYMTRMRNTAENSPEDMARVWRVSHITAIWLAIVFGTLSFIAITSKAYEDFIDREKLKVINKTQKRSRRSIFTMSRRRPSQEERKPLSDHAEVDEETWSGRSPSSSQQQTPVSANDTPMLMTERSQSVRSSTVSTAATAVGTNNTNKKGESFLVLDTIFDPEDSFIRSQSPTATFQSSNLHTFGRPNDVEAQYPSDQTRPRTADTEAHAAAWKVLPPPRSARRASIRNGSDAAAASSAAAAGEPSRSGHSSPRTLEDEEIVETTSPDATADTKPPAPAAGIRFTDSTDSQRRRGSNSGVGHAI